MEALIGRLYKVNMRTILEGIVMGSLDSTPNIMGNGLCYAGKDCLTKDSTTSEKVLSGLTILLNNTELTQAYDFHLACLDKLIMKYVT